MQNQIPRQAFIEFDKAGAEWVVVAYLSGDERMLRIVEDGLSPHTETAHLISRVPRELIEKEDKAIGHHTDPAVLEKIRTEKFPDLLDNSSWWVPRSMSLRQAGKKSNHGLNYNMKYKRFALENEMQETEAKQLVEKYHKEAYPGIKNKWHEQTKRQLSENRTLTNCFGRKRTFRESWGDELFDAAYSFVPQSTIFDITRVGMVSLYNSEDPLMDEVELLAQVHDSILVQLPFRSAEKVARISQIIGNEYLSPELKYGGRIFHIRTTMKIGIDWGGQSMIELSIHEDIDRLSLELEKAWEVVNGTSSAAPR